MVYLVHSLEAEKSSPWAGWLAWAWHLARVCLLHTNMIDSIIRWVRAIGHLKSLFSEGHKNHHENSILFLLLHLILISSPKPNPKTTDILTLGMHFQHMNSRYGALKLSHRAQMAQEEAESFQLPQGAIVAQSSRPFSLCTGNLYSVDW